MSLHFKDLKKGDIIWESGYGTSLEVEVLSDPINEGPVWIFQARTCYGESEFLMNDDYPAYAPHLARVSTYSRIKYLDGREENFFAASADEPAAV